MSNMAPTALISTGAKKWRSLASTEDSETFLSHSETIFSQRPKNLDLLSASLIRGTEPPIDCALERSGIKGIKGIKALHLAILTRALEAFEARARGACYACTLMTNHFWQDSLMFSSLCHLGLGCFHHLGLCSGKGRKYGVIGNRLETDLEPQYGVTSEVAVFHTRFHTRYTNSATLLSDTRVLVLISLRRLAM